MKTEISTAPLGQRFEIKVNLEAMTRCPGSCQGCFMQPEERKYGTFWGEEQFADAQKFVARFVDFHREKLDTASEFEVAVNLGQGDHMDVSSNAMAPATAFIESVYEGRSVAFITASAVSAGYRLASSAHRWKGSLKGKGQAFFADVVFDPMLSNKASFHEKYHGNIQVLREVFGEVDLNINLGPDTIQAISPEELHALVCANDFRILTLNFAPTSFSPPSFIERAPEILEWVKAMFKVWLPAGSRERPKYLLNTFATLVRPILVFRHNKAVGVEVDEKWVVDSLAAELPKMLYVDHDGNVSFVQAGIGDLPVGSRTGWRTIGNIRDLAEDPNLETRIKAGARVLAASIVSSLSASDVCGACPQRFVCAMTGGTHLTKLIGDKSREQSGLCPSGLRELYDLVDQYDSHVLSSACECHIPKAGDENFSDSN